MIEFPNRYVNMCLLFLIAVLNFSCSKDSDLLSDYVIREEGISENYRLVVDDNFYISMDNSVVLDVLSNDGFGNMNNVAVTNTSNPTLGTVVINEDNTLTYTPPQQTASSEEAQEDTFVYTAEETATDGTVTTQEGNVTVSSSSAESRFATSGENVRFVSVNGKSSNNGRSESTAWDIGHAFKAAKAGDIVYIKAGLYSDYNLTQNTNGTTTNPIRFIGYKNTPGDIDPDAQRSFTLGTQTIKVMAGFSYGDKVNSSQMPLLKENRKGNVGSGTAILIKGRFVELYNMQTQYYETGMNWYGDDGKYKNIVMVDLGDFTKDVRDGDGIQHRASNCVVKNIYIENAADQGFTINDADNNSFDAINIVADKIGEVSTNATDYYFLFQHGNGNKATNIYILREGNLQHTGHGICFKTPEECFDNSVINFIIDNTALELQFPGVHENTVKEGYILKRPTTTSENAGGIAMANGSYNNTLSNIFLDACQLTFQDWNDGLAGDAKNASDGNTFNQITSIGGHSAISFHYYGNGNYTSSADNNTFYNCTFYNTKYIFENSRKNSNTTIVNCIFSNARLDFSVARSNSRGYDLDINLSKSNFYDIVGENFLYDEALHVNPNFVDVDNFDFTTQNQSLLGKGVATPFLPEGNDIGAFQN